MLPLHAVLRVRHHLASTDLLTKRSYLRRGSERKPCGCSPAASSTGHEIDRLLPGGHRGSSRASGLLCNAAPAAPTFGARGSESRSELRGVTFVAHSSAAPIHSYGANGQPPRLKKLLLAAKRILVEQDHPAFRRTPGTAYSAAYSRKLSRASLRASAIASWGTFPYHSSTMASQGRPRSTCSRTSETKILVPRNVSLP